MATGEKSTKLGDQTCWAYQTRDTFFKTVLNGDGCKHLLQIGKGMSLMNNPQQTGSVIDIDSFTTDVKGEFMNVLSTFLEHAHHSEKQLFFKILKPEFLNSLNPIYEDGK
jgi:uncharacterized protein (TIGR04255 family)